MIYIFFLIRGLYLLCSRKENLSHLAFEDQGVIKYAMLPAFFFSFFWLRLGGALQIEIIIGKECPDFVCQGVVVGGRMHRLWTGSLPLAGPYA